MVRPLVAGIIYIITLNQTPVATFDTFRGMNKWTWDYRARHPMYPETTSGHVGIYRCVTRDVIGPSCSMYKTFEY
jgi:hypothetical protein